MPEQRPVWLTEPMAATLSFRIVGLGNVHRDYAIAVTRQHAWRVRVGWVRLELEDKTTSRCVISAERQMKSHQGEYQTPLGGLEFEPGEPQVWIGNVRNRMCEATGPAERLFIFDADRPIAGLILEVVLAQTKLSAGERDVCRLPRLAAFGWN